MRTHSRFALGTAQFGLPYGIANQAGQVSREEAETILDHAWNAGLDTLDTAIAYGESERRLGEIGVAQWRVISKLPAIPESCADVRAWVQELVLGSLERLKIPRLGGLLLHRSLQLLEPKGENLYRALSDLKAQGLVEKIGVSTYGPEELDALCPRFAFDLVQSPFSIVDRRLVTSGWLTRLHDAGIEIHVRSVFLQGLLLMDERSRPGNFDRWRQLWEQWHDWLAHQELSALQAALSFASSRSEIDRIVVGVDSVGHFQEILAATALQRIEFPSYIACSDPALINPSEWKKS